MFKNSKSIGPIIAVSLLLIISVLSVLSFNIWFDFYSSKIYSSAEIDTQSTNKIEIVQVIDNMIFIKNDNLNNISNYILKIDNLSCYIGNISFGMNSYDISTCLLNLSTNSPDVTLITNKSINSKKFYLKNIITKQNEIIIPQNLIPQNGLIAEYLFENISNLGYDSSINLNHGISSGPTRIIGAIDNGTNYDGSNDRIDISNVLSDFTNEISVSFWIKVNTDEDLINIIQDYNGDSTGFFGLRTYNYGLRMSVGGDTQIISSNPSYYNPNTWEHFVVTYNSTQVKIWKNGVLDVNQLMTTRPKTSYFFIGKRGSFNSHFLGQLDNIRIYNRILNETEVNILYDE